MMIIMGFYFLFLEIDIYLEFNLMSVNSLSVVYVMYLDWIGLMFMGFVLFISSMIFKYSSSYMSSELYMKRFIMLMGLFVLSMMLLILSLNLIMILLGWDALGLVSYILVIYYQNIKSYNAGKLTVLSNRIGDAALLMGIALSMNFNSWNFLFYGDFYKDHLIMKGLSLFIVLAAITKSAQIPFSSWLPAAMAAPTPVSSLVHSSTLVTAGVYLLIRSFSWVSGFMVNFLLCLALVTMFMAGACANFEFDLKKIIALSTLSQLGMMITILCVGGKELAFFHLLIHALFKALLFMCAGAIIHNLGGHQDIRFMGPLMSYMPLTCTCMNISNFALCGLPFLSGFYSKDLVVEVFSMTVSNFFIYFMFYFSVGLTVSYTMRMSFYIFYGDFNLISLNYLSDNNNLIMLKSMMGLVVAVIFMGSCLSWVMFSTPYFILLPLVLKLCTLLVIFVGGWLGYEMNYMFYFYQSKFSILYQMSLFMGAMWMMPVMSTYGLNYYFLYLGKLYYKKVDQGWLEFYGGHGVLNLSKKVSQIMQSLSQNHLKFIFFIGLVNFIFLLFMLM
uniref:NADH-ubiquinone oxidoreductase chain 5 n=1 Tax=Hylastes attenuatus TaxID=471226 RepID=A0A343A6J1_9CUCU|nr:NADH dehydrogenase subunit 5 [Hylastes attenuatus]AOY40183.1 NADH dehydrogenase subunit 5 [Hylastes attenuatus]